MSQVIVYTTPTCHFCHATKDFLQENHVDYQEVDVTKDPAQAQAMIAKSGQMGVPVIDYNGEIVVGFDEGRLEKLVQKS